MRPRPNSLPYTAKMAASRSPLRGWQFYFPIPDKLKRNFRVRKRQPIHQRCHRCSLGAVLLQKFHPGRDIVEEIFCRNGGSHRAARLRQLSGTLPGQRVPASRSPRSPRGSVSPFRSPRRWRPTPPRGSPSVPMRSRSSGRSTLLVACRRNAFGTSSRSMPQPLSVTRMSRTPPCPISTVMAVARHRLNFPPALSPPRRDALSLHPPRSAPRFPGPVY